MNDTEPLTTTEAYRRIRTAAVAAALHFNNLEIRLNQLEGRKREVRQIAFRVRDAIIYRFDAVLYHFGLLQRVQQDAETELRTQGPAPDNQDILRAVTLRQRFLFDDLVVNCVAFFDYIGRFVVLLAQADQNLKLRWDRAYKWAKHPNAGGAGNNRLHGTRVGDLIVEADQQWVRRLTKYRSEVIHYEAEKLGGSVTTTYTKSDKDGASEVSHQITPHVPSRFIRELKLADEEVSVPIIQASEYLIGRVLETAGPILGALAQEIEQRVPDPPDDGMSSGGPVVTTSG